VLDRLGEVLERGGVLEEDLLEGEGAVLLVEGDPHHTSEVQAGVDGLHDRLALDVALLRLGDMALDVELRVDEAGEVDEDALLARLSLLVGQALEDRLLGSRVEVGVVVHVHLDDR
jgi:hypothetical protein